MIWSRAERISREKVMEQTFSFRSHKARNLVSAFALVTVLVLFQTALSQQVANPNATAEPFTSLALYNGTWKVRADKPWSGGANGSTGLLISRCQRFTAYFACEQTVNGKVDSLLVYTVTADPGRLRSRMIAPNGLAGGRGDLMINCNHRTYVDKPPAGLEGNWSRVEN